MRPFCMSIKDRACQSSAQITWQPASVYGHAAYIEGLIIVTDLLLIHAIYRSYPQFISMQPWLCPKSPFVLENSEQDMARKRLGEGILLSLCYTVFYSTPSDFLGKAMQPLRMQRYGGYHTRTVSNKAHRSG